MAAFHSNEEVEIVAREWVGIGGADLYCEGIFKLVPRWGKYVGVFADRAHKW
jgi:hypothetical protein